MTTRRRERKQGGLLLLCLLLSLGALLGTANILQAQERTGTVTGVLKDASGGVLPGATVVMTNKTTGRVTTVVTDGSGMYRADLDPGMYDVRFEMSGFARQEQPDVEMLLGRTLTINVTMKVGNMAEAVQVTAESSPQVDLRNTMIAHNVTAEEFDRLPKGRSFQSIAMTAASVNSGEIEGGYQVNGASGAENAYTVDGVVTNSLINGASRQNTVFEYLQEIQVKTTGISAEYGGALGGVISAVTKSGGNTLHGEGHWYFDGNTLGASPVKRLVLSPADEKTVTYVQDEKQPDNRNEVGGSVGGPIVHDHLWYFGSLSPKFNRRTNTYKFVDGASTTGDIKRDQDLMQAFGKLSYGSRRFNAYSTALYTPTTSKGTLSTYNGTLPNGISSTEASNVANRTRGYEIKQTSTTHSVDIMLSQSSLMNVRGGYFFDEYKDTGIPLTTSWSYQTVCCPLSNAPGLAGPVGTQNVPRAQLNLYDTTKRGFVNADYSQNFHAAGFHNLKAGAGFQHSVNEVRKAYPGGYVFVNWDSTLTNPNGSRGTGKYGYYEVNDVGTIGRAGANLSVVFIQDQWQVSERLTLNLGIRTEDEKLPTFRPDILKYAFHFKMKDKLAPRLSAAYDLRGDGKVKLFGSWGRYFDFTKYELARGSFGGDTWKTWYRAIDDSNLTSFQTAHVGADGTCVGCTGTDLWQVPGSFRDQRIPDFAGLDPNIKPMSQDSTNGGIDYQLGPTTVLTVHFVHNKLNRTIEDIGALVDGSETYIYGNPGEGLATVSPTNGLTKPFATPTAKRKYDALEVGWEKRFSNRWFASANYTLSRLWGNYAGLASSDEIRTPTLGVGYPDDQNQAAGIARAGGNETRSWDLDELLWDSHGNLDVTGLLPTDRTHVVKMSGAYSLPIGTTIGGVFYGGSGTPLTTYVNSANNIPLMVNGRGDLGRTPMLTRTDILVSHELRVGSRALRGELNLLNVFNQKSTRHSWNSLNRGYAIRRSSSQISTSQVDLAKGYDYNALIAATPDASAPVGALDPRWLQPDLFSDGLTGTFMLKFIF